MQNDIYHNILNQINTTHEADLLLQKIDAMLSSIYQTNQKSFSEIFSFELPHELSTAIQATLIAQSLTFAHPEELKQFLLRLKKLLQSTSLLTLTIAFSPSSEALSAISKQAKNLFGITTIIEVNVQENILGGAIVIYRGKYIDCSLKSKVERVFKSQSKDILGVLT